MDKNIKEFLGRLKRVKTKAWEEKLTPKAVYDRVKAGVYKKVVIDGIMFILEDK